MYTSAVETNTPDYNRFLLNEALIVISSYSIPPVYGY